MLGEGEDEPLSIDIRRLFGVWPRSSSLLSLRRCSFSFMCFCQILLSYCFFKEVNVRGQRVCREKFGSFSVQHLHEGLEHGGISS